jgi:hypothetical protein
MFIKRCEEATVTAPYHYPSGNKHADELFVYLKAWRTKQGTKALNESEFADVLAMLTEKKIVVFQRTCRTQAII